MRECLVVQEILSIITSQNMPCWYYAKLELRDTPSIRDGVPLETERRYRKEGARFIMTCGTQMGLGHNTMATGVVYFHRFYMFHSFKNFPRYVTACCCLLLAGKVEETPKKCRDIIRTARSLLSDSYFYSFGEDPKEEVMTLERILLQTIKFDLQVEHPYSFLLKYAKCFKGDQAKLQKMVQMAWNFVNDSLSTVVCLQWEPEIIAVALIHLASKLSKFAVNDWEGKQPSHVRWWDMFVSDVTMEIIEDICHQVLDLYQSNQKETDTNSPPQKPPSRADSPTRLRHATRTAPTSPPTKSKHPATVTNPAALASCSSTASSSSSSMGQINNNIQSIKSLASNPSHSLAPPLPTSAMPAPPAAPSYSHGVHPHSSHHHMYPPMPPGNQHSSMHMYGNAVGPSTSSNSSSYSAPAPPLPPTPPMPPIPPHPSMHNHDVTQRIHNMYSNTSGPSTSSSYGAPPPPMPPNRWWW